MGADMIGFLVKGPHKLDDRNDELAVQTVLRAHQFYGAWADVMEACEEAGTTFDNSAEGKNLKRRFPREGVPSDMWFTVEGMDADYARSLMLCEADDENLEERVRQLVEKFKSFWRDGGYRDTVWRVDPDDSTRVLVFAGELSWGDEPSGAGYQLLKDADQYGILEVYGIR